MTLFLMFEATEIGVFFTELLCLAPSLGRWWNEATRCHSSEPDQSPKDRTKAI
jgi:hypothetical protein